MDYFKIEGAPGEYFRCEAYRASMSVPGCAKMYQSEKSNRDGRHAHCYGCKIGAEHAGEKVAAMATPVYQSKICPRCHAGATRIVKGLCISCLNRQYEVEKGRNSKGSKPVKAAPLVEVTLHVTNDEKVSVVKIPLATGRLEGIYRVLRVQPGNPLFGWRADVPSAPQASLFDAPVVGL